MGVEGTSCVVVVQLLSGREELTLVCRSAHSGSGEHGGGRVLALPCHVLPSDDEQVSRSSNTRLRDFEEILKHSDFDLESPGELLGKVLEREEMSWISLAR